MARILLLFASSYGQTEKVADRLAGHLRERGHEVVVRSIKDGSPPSPDGFDAVVIGSRLAVKYSAAVLRYVQKQRAALERVPSAFFSVSMSAASPDPRGPAGAEDRIHEFLAQGGWTPTRVASFAGALPYTRYDPVTRFVMKRISARTGATTDTSRDHEYTNWRQVGDFAASIADLLVPQQRAVAHSAASP
jgi:menaquinone-dependent protoporphyrinogen oxidase